MLDKSMLAQFSGTENYFRHRFSPVPLVYTDGVKYVAENGGGNGAYWLIDAIASYQLDSKIKNNRMLQECQFWHLEVKDSSAILTCKADSGYKPAITQEIEYTDFDFSIDLWMEPTEGPDGRLMWVLYLPSER